MPRLPSTAAAEAEILARHDSELNDMRGTKAIKEAGASVA